MYMTSGTNVTYYSIQADIVCDSVKNKPIYGNIKGTFIPMKNDNFNFLIFQKRKVMFINTVHRKITRNALHMSSQIAHWQLFLITLQT